MNKIVTKSKKFFIEKRSFFRFFLLLISVFSIASIGIAYAQEQFSGKEEDVPLSSARIFSKVVKKVGLNPDADWFQTFGTTNEEDVGKDLYLVIYSKIQDKPRQQANKEVAEKYNISEADLIRIRYNDYGPLLSRKPQIRQEDLQKKINEIRSAYDTAKDILDMKARLQAKVEISEIFANGNVDDSGFDLINDLDRIEQLLFLETSAIDIGKPYKTPSQQAQEVAKVTSTQLQNKSNGANGENIGTSQQNIQGNIKNLGQVNTAGVNTGGIKIQKTGHQGDNSSGSNNSGVTTSPALRQGATDISSSTPDCASDNSYDTALQQFEEAAQKDSHYIDLSKKDQQTPDTLTERTGTKNSTPGSKIPNGSQTGSSEQTGSASQASTDTSQDFLPAKSDPAASENTASATADSWKQPSDCNDVFCLKVDLIKKPATSSFVDTDNCISCNLQHINDEMKHVIDHTLTPNKVTGNMIEPAKCKNALSESFSSISMNIYSIGLPVKTPPNDELVDSTSVKDDWQRYCEASAFFPFASCKPQKDPASSYAPPPILVDQVTKKVLSELPQDASLAQATNRINEMVNGYIIAQSQDMANTELEHEGDAKVRFFQSMQSEMTQMNSYFQNMSDILQSLHEKVDGVAGKQACTALKNKKECS